MFRRLPDLPGRCSTFTVDGAPVQARDGDTVAAAMAAAGFSSCRTSAGSQVARGPYCFMGVCFECLVTIDGVGNRQACLVPVMEGMRVERRGARDITAEVNRDG